MGLAVKRGHGVPIAKLNYMKNRGHIISPIFLILKNFSTSANSNFSCGVKLSNTFFYIPF